MSSFRAMVRHTASWRLIADPKESSASTTLRPQGAANILGMAIERQRYERHLKAALDRHQVLLKEISHRVKNSLQIVSSMLHLQASSANDDSLIAQQLAEASSRVSAIGRAYERLAYDADFENIDLSAYLQAVCADAISAGLTAT